LRNALHRQLRAVYGADWYDNPATGLDAGGLSRIDAAKNDLQRGGYGVDAPHVVAALPFGFWVSLLGRGGHGRAPDTGKKNYDMTLWRKAVYKAFPHSNQSRVDTHKPLDYLRTLRNRIAHHEPIFARHLEADFLSILAVTGWICPATADWIKHHSRVDELLGSARDDGGIRF
jgi:hypothetical protein